MRKKNLEVNISPALQSILQEVQLFGNININTRQSTLQIKPGRKEQAQNLVPAIPRIEEIKPTMLRTLTIPEDTKSESTPVCMILPDGKCMILDFLKKEQKLSKRTVLCVFLHATRRSPRAPPSIASERRGKRPNANLVWVTPAGGPR